MCKQYQINQCVNIHVYDKHNGELNTKVVVFFNIFQHAIMCQTSSSRKSKTSWEISGLLRGSYM